MNYLEDFFSLDKFYYPATFSIIGGVVFFAIFFLLGLNFNEIILYFFIGIGFLLGNHIKVLQIQKQFKIENKSRKKSKIK